jgi:urea carboxylase-associated protein 2
MRSLTSLRHEIPGGAAWSMPVRAGRLVTLTAGGADANASTLIFGSDRLDRLNVPDTLKAQMSACIRPPMVLMSDRGLALASVVGSSLDWHDALGGHGLAADLERFGPSSYQADRNDWRRSARTGLISELAKHGLGERDLHGSVNFFAKLGIADDARASLAFVPGHSQAGDTVTLRTEQDVLILLATGPHPLNPSADYAPPSVTVEVTAAEPVADDDPSVLFRAESARALEMTRMATL